MAKKVWKVGKKWAGIKPSGKRFMVDSREQALKLAGGSGARTALAKKTKSNPKKRKNVNKLAKKRSRRKKSLTVPLSIVGALAAGLAEPAKLVFVDKDPGRALALVGARYSGVDTRNPSNVHFNTTEIMIGLGSLVVGGLVHKFVGGAPLNVNRMLAASGIPFIRV